MKVPTRTVQCVASFLLLLLLPAAACGPSSPSGGPPTACTGTYSGPLSGSFLCTAAATYDRTSDTASLLIDASGVSGAAWDLVFEPMHWTGAMAPGIVTGESAALQSAYGQVMAESGVWLVTRGWTGFADQGSISLRLDSAVQQEDGTYEVHGALTASFASYPAATQGSAPITASIRF